MIDAATAARIFHDWAHTEGLIPEGPMAILASSAEDYAKIKGVTAQGKQLLRAKGVYAIASNEPKERISVFTKRAAPASKKLLSTLPSAVENIEIEYRQGVQEPVGGPPSLPFGGPAYAVRQTNGLARYTCGSSISVGNYREAGTLGALVRDQAGQIFGLSNNHVSGSCSFAGVGLPIVAPGIFDVVPMGLAPFTIGFHHQALAMVPGAPDNVQWTENSDAALIRMANDALVSSFQGAFYDTPNQTGPMIDNAEVQKVGRTTQLTKGKVIGRFFGAHSVTYSAAQYGFSGVVYFDSMFAIHGVGGAFSQPGDSGSLICSIAADGSLAAVGLVVGGMHDGKAPGECVTIALPIEPILQKLGVSIVSGHNV